MNVLEDPLSPLGVGVGVLLVLVGMATLVGTPWAYKSGSAVVMVGQILGALSAIAIGAGLAWLVYTRK
jgi:hypothetical protein